MRLRRRAGGREKVTSIEKIPLFTHLSESAAFSELKAVLDLIASGMVSVGATTLAPGKSTVAAVQGSFDTSDFLQQVYSNVDSGGKEPIRGFAWPILVQGLGFAKAESSGKLKLTKQGILAQNTANLHVEVKNAFSKWLKFDFDELSRINVIKGQTGKGRRALVKPADRRPTICSALKTLPALQWLEVSELIRFLRSEFQFHVIWPGERSLWHLYIGEPQNGSLGYADDRFSLVEKPYLLCVLMEYLSTLGLIDICYSKPDRVLRDHWNQWGADDLEFYSRYDGLHAIRLNDFGRYCLGASDAYLFRPESKQTMIVLSYDAEVKPIAGSFTKKEESELECWTSVNLKGQRYLDRKQSLVSLESGRSAQELRAFLTERTDCEFPESVEGFLSQLETQERSFAYFDSAHIFSVNDKGLLQRLLSEPQTSKHCFKMQGDLIGVFERDRRRFQKGLKDLGLYLPGTSQL